MTEKKVELLYEKRRFVVYEEDLLRAIKETREEELRREKERGVISTHMGMYEIAAGLRISACFACGSFEDYTGACRYSPKVLIVQGEKKSGLCQKSDVPLEMAIKSGKLNQYEIKGG